MGNSATSDPSMRSPMTRRQSTHDLPSPAGRTSLRPLRAAGGAARLSARRITSGSSARRPRAPAAAGRASTTRSVARRCTRPPAAGTACPTTRSSLATQGAAILVGTHGPRLAAMTNSARSTMSAISAATIPASPAAGRAGTTARARRPQDPTLTARAVLRRDGDALPATGGWADVLGPSYRDVRRRNNLEGTAESPQPTTLLPIPAVAFVMVTLNIVFLCERLSMN
mmetsp:Transcript_7774/g.16116  ORF Transcript_7774/g.16116 Transcript_7774/m.16116 type:complete len:227 (+) Transcript_7774:286-966(+)